MEGSHPRILPYLSWGRAQRHRQIYRRHRNPTGAGHGAGSVEETHDHDPKNHETQSCQQPSMLEEQI